MNRHALSGLLILLAAFLLAAAPAVAVDTIYLVRHAEKVRAWPAAPEAADLIPLSSAGERRAAALAARLKGAGVGAVYTSRTTRAIATAVPLAAVSEIPLLIDDATIKKEKMGAFLARARRNLAGARAVLIVGHSNTVPELLIALGATKACYRQLGIREEKNGQHLIDGYDGLWKVDLKKPGCAGMRREALAVPAR